MQPPEAEAGFDVWVPPFTDMPAFERRIAEEWAPSCRNLTYKFEQKGNLYGQALVTPVDSSNHWWGLLEDAVSKVDGKLSPPEISPSATDGRFIRAAGWPAFGFSPISNTPILLHEHNEVCYFTFSFFCNLYHYLRFFSGFFISLYCPLLEGCVSMKILALSVF
jgi:aminoacylase